MTQGKYVLLISTFACHAAFGNCSVDVIAHRGDSAAYPENTVIAIREALIKGARYIEADVRLSADDVPVLMHDNDVDRTTNASGRTAEFAAAELANLDAGSWKGASFAGEGVPTLEQAITTAYPKAQLYLDVKVDGLAQPLAKLLAEAKLPPDSIIVAVNNADVLRAYHSALPDTPLTWFGAVADDWDNAWLDMLTAHNVHAIELYWPTLQRVPNVRAFVSQAKQKKIAVWTYLLNDTESYRAAMSYGVSGIETDFPELLADVCNRSTPSSGPQPQIAGQWDFSRGNLFASRGSQLVPVQLPTDALMFGTTAELHLPPLAGGVTTVARINALTPGQGLIMYPNMQPTGQGNGEFINQYSLIMDALRPSAADDHWQALLQTDVYNRSDADLFINPQGAIGANGSYYGRVEINRWNRIAIVVDLLSSAKGEMRIFIDGALVGSLALDGLDGRWSIYSTLSSLGTLLFSDDSGETAPLVVSSIQIRNYAMTTEAVAALGKASATGIPEH